MFEVPLRTPNFATERSEIVAQTHDIMLDGAGYMIVPGSYSYAVAGAQAAPVRAGIPSFAQAYAAGQHSATVIDRDMTRWTAVGMRPAPIGLGDEPGRLILAPGEVFPTLGVSAFDSNSQAVIYGGEVYFSQGASLYKVVRASGNWSTIAFVGTAAGAITSMAVIYNLLFMACAAPATTMSNYAVGAGITNAPAAQAAVIWQYAQGIWRSKGNDPTTISGSIDGGATWAQWPLDSAVRAVVPWRGRSTGGGVMLIATNFMLWELAGQWTGSPAEFIGTVSPLYSGLGGGGTDDFAWLVEFNGLVYTWYAGSVHLWDGVRLEPVPGGPRGVTHGGCVAGGTLCVSTTDPATGYTTISCYDGLRWFVLARGNSRLWANLCGTSGIIGDGHLLAFGQGGAILSRWALPVSGFAAPPATSGNVTVGPLDGGQGDTIKTWTRVVIDWSLALQPSQLAPPTNPGGTLLVETSVDDGSSWATQGTVTVAAGATSRQESVAFAAAMEAQRLLVRVTWTPASAYAAFQIDGIWASGWTIADAQHRETWTMKLKVTDKLITRDGSVDARTGETMLQALRSLAQTGRTATFHDLDDDLAPTARTVRVAELKEAERKGDGTHFLESQVTLTLTAVA
jgi:hypothetical protein